MTSPYLLRPLRTEAQAAAEIERAAARRRMAHLRTGDGMPIEPMPSIDERREEQARAAGLADPKAP